MSLFKCKMCGGTLNVNTHDGIAECEYCGTLQTLPKSSDEVVSNLFNRANNLRLRCEFDKAESIYEKILEIDNTECEAHWGMILCKYGIEYVEDPKTFKRIPTCHRTSYEPIMTSTEYLAALEHADDAQKEVYEHEAKEIDSIQRSILSIVENEKPFDVFICYKESDESGKRTLDSTIANEIYYQLVQEGFKVFYAAITLEDKLGQEYEPYIFAALNSAKVMLVIGTKPEYFEAVWVKNEWSRFMKLMKTDRSKLLIPCYKDMDAYDLPEDFSHLQAQDMGKIGFINDITRGIKKVLSPKEKVEYTQINSIPSAGGTNISPLLKRAFMFLEDGDWNSAKEYCEKVLDLDPECAEAYLGKLMAELQVKTRKQLADCTEPFDDKDNYSKVLRFGDEKLENEMRSYIAHINNRNEKARLTSTYNNAVDVMRSAQTEDEYKAAFEMFKTIPGFKDADLLAEQCFDNAEAKRLERDRQAEISRKKVEERAKRNKKIAIITTPIVCIAIAFVILFNDAIVLKLKLSKAMELIDSEEYESAYAILEELGENGLIISNKYDRAVKHIDSGDYETAYTFLNRLIYKDRTEKANFIFAEYKKIILNNASVGDYVFFGSYEQDNDISNGKENIEWLVLAKEENKILVISKYAFDCKQYNTSDTDVTWETCTLREWLNGNFINTAFSDDEKAMISTVTVPAGKNIYNGTNPGNDTQDKVFLLNILEAKTYFHSDITRPCEATDYADTQGVYVNSSDGNCWWWLRSPGSMRSKTCRVYSDGSIDYSGVAVNCDNGAVRPAMWIDLAATK